MVREGDGRLPSTLPRLLSLLTALSSSGQTCAFFRGERAKSGWAKNLLSAPTASTNQSGSEQVKSRGIHEAAIHPSKNIFQAIPEL
ncbi:unnamed protein product [Bursaphelenchus xylophilus]|uniref:(pine wood nematode) hypothetical protein n=1 Tax=Bursaphelenchus xylophilus TaxID=6326 RepID=A0A1I7SLZ3_BURXY|nr:unnamed protein product [Bursaphelenchus xylophilus]CAG9129941.1 unnamed protein product [Bursaphelenchus xylophilus]